MNGRDGVLEVTWFQHARVEHKGVELWEGDRRSVGGGVDATPNAIPMNIFLVLQTTDRSGAEAKRLPMEYERRQIRNPPQHCAKCAEINHDPEGPRVITVPPQCQRR